MNETKIEMKKKEEMWKNEEVNGIKKELIIKILKKGNQEQRH
jgi:hypothetical protein